MPRAGCLGQAHIHTQNAECKFTLRVSQVMCSPSVAVIPAIGSLLKSFNEHAEVDQRLSRQCLHAAGGVHTD